MTPRESHHSTCLRTRMGAGDMLGGYVDLLTQPMNERLLEQMLAGEWQVWRFSGQLQTLQ